MIDENGEHYETIRLREEGYTLFELVEDTRLGSYRKDQVRSVLRLEAYCSNQEWIEMSAAHLSFNNHLDNHTAFYVKREEL